MVKCPISEKYDLSKFSFVVAKGSPIEMELKNNEVKDNFSSKKSTQKNDFELTKGRKIIDNIISMLYIHYLVLVCTQKAVNKSRSADSNIFFSRDKFLGWIHRVGTTQKDHCR